MYFDIILLLVADPGGAQFSPPPPNFFFDYVCSCFLYPVWAQIAWERASKTWTPAVRDFAHIMFAPPPPFENPASAHAYCYTERQKKLITSSERGSLKSTAWKLIMFRHKISYHILLKKHIWKVKWLLLPKRRKCDEIATDHFQKPQKLLIENLPKRSPIQNINLVNLVFNGGLYNRRTGFCPCVAGRREVSVILERDLLQFHPTLLLFLLNHAFVWF